MGITTMKKPARHRAVLVLEDNALLAGLPLMMLDVLGRSPLLRMVDELKLAGVTDVTVIGSLSKERKALLDHEAEKMADWIDAAPDSLWQTAEQSFAAIAAGCESVIVARLHAYAELDWKQLLGHHRAYSNRVTRAWTGSQESEQPLDIFVLGTSRRNDAAYLFRNALRQSRIESVRYTAGGDEYVKLVESPADIRQLAVDGLMMRSSMKPIGKEIKPGVWVGPGSRIDSTVRLVAPAFIGKRVKVGAGAVVTRNSAIEHHSIIDCGTVVDDSSIQPYTQLGAGLDLMKSVVCRRSIFNLKRKSEIEIFDPKLLREISPSALQRVASQSLQLMAYLPVSLVKGLRKKQVETPAVDSVCDVGNFGTANVFNRPADPALAKLNPGLAVMRRYGNQ